jgi:hypothetical protein
MFAFGDFFFKRSKKKQENLSLAARGFNGVQCFYERRPP